MFALCKSVFRWSEQTNKLFCIYAPNLSNHESRSHLKWWLSLKISLVPHNQQKMGPQLQAFSSKLCQQFLMIKSIHLSIISCYFFCTGRCWQVYTKYVRTLIGPNTDTPNSRAQWNLAVDGLPLPPGGFLHHRPSYLRRWWLHF